MNPSDPSAADDVSHRGSILLVDDEQPLLEIYEAILRPHFEVVTAGTAQEADRILREKTFKVIVADHRMPGETGLSFLTRARDLYPHVQRVLMTGNMTEEMRRNASRGNLLFSFLVKPISIAELTKIVQAAADAHDTAVAKKMSSPPDLTRKPVVLLVDDEPEICNVLELGLKGQCEMESARSAEEAELMLATKTYDVIVCDHLMPEEEGVAFLTRTMTLFPDVRRILMTGYTNPELLARCTGLADLSGVLVKPVRAYELMAAINQALGRKGPECKSAGAN